MADLIAVTDEQMTAFATYLAGQIPQAPIHDTENYQPWDSSLTTGTPVGTIFLGQYGYNWIKISDNNYDWVRLSSLTSVPSSESQLLKYVYHENDEYVSRPISGNYDHKVLWHGFVFPEYAELGDLLINGGLIWLRSEDAFNNPRWIVVVGTEGGSGGGGGEWTEFISWEAGFEPESMPAEVFGLEPNYVSDGGIFYRVVGNTAQLRLYGLTNGFNSYPSFELPPEMVPTQTNSNLVLTGVLHGYDAGLAGNKSPIKWGVKEGTWTILGLTPNSHIANYPEYPTSVQVVDVSWDLTLP